MPGVRDRIAVVTGAANGLGREIALLLAREGARVVLGDLDAAGLDKTAAAIAAAGGTAMAVAGDLTEEAPAQRLIAACVERFGRIDILVNDVGGSRNAKIWEMKAEDWDQVITTNLTSAFRLSKACLRRMVKERRGRIVNLTSVVGVTGHAGQANYAAAKAGILGFTKSLAKEVASRGITVNAVAPGFIDTDMTRALSEEQRTALLTQIPMGRLGAPADVAAVVLFLVSPAASYITGETLHVNGGMYMP